MSDSDESGGDESPLDSGSDWSEAGKEAAAEAAEAAAEDDDVSMAGDSDNSPGSADASKKKDGGSRKRQKPSPQKVLSKLNKEKQRRPCKSTSLPLSSAHIVVLVVAE